MTDPSRRWSQRLADLLDRHRRALFTLMVLFYLAGFSNHWLMGPDSALYLTLGRNLALGRGYTFQGVPHSLVYPGLPIAIAGLQKCFPHHLILAANALILLCALATVGLTYRLMRMAIDRPTATVIALGLGFSFQFFRYSYEILTEIPFCMGVMALLAGHEAIFGPRAGTRKVRWPDWLLLIGGLAIAVITRPTMLGLLGAWAAAMAWTALRRPAARRAILIGMALALVAAVLFFKFDPRHGQDNSGISGGYEEGMILQLTRNPTVYLKSQIPANLSILFPQGSIERCIVGHPGIHWIDAGIGALIVIGGLSLTTLRPLWGFWVAATLVMLVIVQAHDRYVIQIMPLLLLGWWRVLGFIERKLPAGQIIWLILIGTCILTNTVRDENFIAQQRRTNFYAHYKETTPPGNGPFAGVVAISTDLAAATTSDDLILMPAPTKANVLAFLTDRRVRVDWGTQPYKNLYVVIDPDDPDNNAKWLAVMGVQISGSAKAQDSNLRLYQAMIGQ